MMVKFTEEELERLEELEERIAGLRSGYGCKPVEYSVVKLARRAIELDEFQAFILIGGKGHGKSTYSIKSVAFYFMRYEGLSCGEAYLEALGRIAFTGLELMKVVEEYGDLVIWDDAGLHGSTYYWFVDGMREYVIALSNWYDVARTDVKVLIASTPSKRKLPPTLRSDPEAILVRVRRHGVKLHPGLGKKIKESEAVGVRNIESLYEEKVIRQELFRDVFLVYLPDPVYEYYEIVRRKYSELARKSYYQALEKAKQKLTYTPPGYNETQEELEEG